MGNTESVKKTLDLESTQQVEKENGKDYTSLLPLELIVNVLINLTYKQVILLGRINSTFYAATNSKELWKKFIANSFPQLKENSLTFQTETPWKNYYLNLISGEQGIGQYHRTNRVLKDWKPLMATESNLHRVVILGITGSGKTSFFRQMVKNYFKHKDQLQNNFVNPLLDYPQTIGFEVHVLDIPILGAESLISKSSCRISLWDIGGNVEIFPLWPHYLIGTEVFIYMIDGSDHDGLQTASQLFFQFIEKAKTHHEELPEFLFLVNKSDKPETLPLYEISLIFELQKRVPGQWIMLPISVKDWSGIDKALEWLCRGSWQNYF